ncbi:hypothetical protein LZ31DRAFT_81257 [Colletotrichum somersetense]|nr:hypothetical protein LZ31DRAFT_81257 [Colletotrichum somersetense]
MSPGRAQVISRRERVSDGTRSTSQAWQCNTTAWGVGCRGAPVQRSRSRARRRPDETFRSNGRSPSQRARMTSTAESLVATVRSFSPMKTPSETRSWPAELSRRRPDAFTLQRAYYLGLRIHSRPEMTARGQSLDLLCCANKRECDLRPRPHPVRQTELGLSEYQDRQVEQGTRQRQRRRPRRR